MARFSACSICIARTRKITRHPKTLKRIYVCPKCFNDKKHLKKKDFRVLYNKAMTLSIQNGHQIKCTYTIGCYMAVIHGAPNAQNHLAIIQKQANNHFVVIHNRKLISYRPADQSQ